MTAAADRFLRRAAGLRKPAALCGTTAALAGSLTLAGTWLFPSR